MFFRPLQMFLVTAGIMVGSCAGHAGNGTNDQYNLDAASKTLSGQYLASHFAQNQYDWTRAYDYLEEVLKADPYNAELVKRAMILAVGSGRMDLAARKADKLLTLEEENDFALLIKAVNEAREDQMNAAARTLESMQAGDMTDFVKPILKGWIFAAQDKVTEANLEETSIHLVHGALMALHRGDEKKALYYTQMLLDAGVLSNLDALRTADLLAALGKNDDAMKIYESLILEDPKNKVLRDKADIVKQDKPLSDAFLTEQVDTARQGAALALYDMAYILYAEQSDGSTKLFAHMALALNPALTEARILLADTLARNSRFDEAIALLEDIPADHPSYLPSQRHVAELMADAGRFEQAREKLNALFTKHNDVESLIRIGDLYRQEENYKTALRIYKQAASQIGETIPEEYWYLLYARGMAYEREGQWGKAEKDLKAALVYRPDHPYLLNYLGYAWAEQGINLEESLELIKQAVALRPHDGYIIDSLGWVQYMMGRYDKALPNLEKAVELLPYDATINDHLGDAYWKAGRKLEARFQWQRALNHAEDDEMRARIEEKLLYGLTPTRTAEQFNE